MYNPTNLTVPDKKLYAIKWVGDYCEPYGISHPIAERLIARALNRDLPYRGILFDYDNTVGKVTALEQLPKKSGKLMLTKISIGEDDPEEHLVISCVDDLGNTIDQETARRLFNLKAKTYDINEAFESKKLEEIFESQKAEIIRVNNQKIEQEFDAEVEKLERWSTDRKSALEIKLKELDKKIREAKKNARSPHTLEEKIEIQRQQQKLDSE